MPVQERLDRLFHRMALRRITRRGAALAQKSPRDLSDIAKNAGQVARAAEGLRRRAEARLIDATGPSPLPELPSRTEWAGRAGFWNEGGRSACPAPTGTALGTGLTLHHDGEADRVCAHASSRPPGPVRFALAIETTDFSGSYVSLSLDLPDEASQKLTPQSLIRVVIAVALERPLASFARLNVRQGPNTEQQVRAIEFGQRNSAVEFDLFYMDILEGVDADIWVDLIFENPRLARIDIADAVFIHRRRAGL